MTRVKVRERKEEFQFPRILSILVAQIGLASGGKGLGKGLE